MKKQFIGITTAIVLVFGTASLIGCGGEHQHEEHAEGAHEHHVEKASETEAQAAHAHYACPMDCEDGKVYEEAGSCPVCKMDLVVVEEETSSAETHDNEHTFSCPMHPEITGHDGDKCSECGMDLEGPKD